MSSSCSVLNSRLETVYREQIAEVESTVDETPGFGEPEHMSNQTRIGFLGCGNMGGAILEGMLAEKLYQPSEVLVCEHSVQRRTLWAQKGVGTTAEAEELSGLETVVLAVKPQSFSEAVRGLGALEHSTLIISVMAGITSNQIAEALGPKARVVRVMPNTPCGIGMGISAMASGVGSGPDELEETSRLMSTVGAVVSVEEDAMHAVTATSGSGPAYLFFLAEAWIEASIKAGLDPEIAKKLVIETIQGSAALLKQHGDPESLRKMVTSRGGTTAAGIQELEERGVRSAMHDAVVAARDRHVELGREGG